MPIFIWEMAGERDAFTHLSGGFYGFPAIDGPDGGVKLATERYDATVDPDRRAGRRHRPRRLGADPARAISGAVLPLGHGRAAADHVVPLHLHPGQPVHHRPAPEPSERTDRRRLFGPRVQALGGDRGGRGADDQRRCQRDRPDPVRARAADSRRASADRRGRGLRPSVDRVAQDRGGDRVGVGGRRGIVVDERADRGAVVQQCQASAHLFGVTGAGGPGQIRQPLSQPPAVLGGRPVGRDATGRGTRPRR